MHQDSPRVSVMARTDETLLSHFDLRERHRPSSGGIRLPAPPPNADLPPWPTPGGQPIAGPGVSQHALGVITRKDGKKQVTYDGWPLYTYFVDRAPGQVIGQGVKDALGTWYVVYASPAKNPAPKS